MKFNKILLCFWIGVPLCIAIRLFQLCYSIEAKTGFYLPGKEKLGIGLIFVPFVIALALYIIGRFTRRRPKALPKLGIINSIFSLLSGVCIFYSVMIEAPSIQMTTWQILLLQILGLLATAFFIAFALSNFFKFKIPGIVYTLPTIYMIIKMICDFTTISKLALISDNVLLITTYCLLLLFLLNFAKLYNELDSEKNPVKLLSFGLSSAALCFTTSVPGIAMYFITNKAYLHTSLSTNLFLLLMGIFITTFLLSRFSRKNLE